MKHFRNYSTVQDSSGNIYGNHDTNFNISRRYPKALRTTVFPLHTHGLHAWQSYFRVIKRAMAIREGILDVAISLHSKPGGRRPPKTGMGPGRIPISLFAFATSLSQYFSTKEDMLTTYICPSPSNFLLLSSALLALFLFASACELSHISWAENSWKCREIR